MSGTRTRGAGDDDREWPDPPGLGKEPRPIEPGHPSAENAGFVLLGALGACYVIARLVGLL